jgi:hypothetical protein
MNTTTKTPIASIHDDIDGQNRQFIWTVYSDGSAMTREITRHTSDPALPMKETYREVHEAETDMARDIHRLAHKKGLTSHHEP